jgi:IS5 family transposase
MTPGQPDAVSRTALDLFRERLDNMLNRRHALYRLAELPDWSVFDKAFGARYCPDNGCPGKPTRLMVGLQYLKHCYGLSDGAVVSGRGPRIRTGSISAGRRTAGMRRRQTRAV